MTPVERALRVVLGDHLVDTFLDDQRFRAARRAPLLDASDARVGETCRVTGRIAIDGDLDLAPFSLRPCAFWTVRLSLKVRDVDARGNEHIVWKTLAQATSSRPFWIVDQRGGSVLVEPERALVAFEPELLDSEHPHLNDENPTFSSFLRSQGVLTHAFMGIANEHRFYETTAQSGRAIVVCGRVDEVARNVAQGYRDGSQLEKRLRNTPRHRLVALEV